MQITDILSEMGGLHLCAGTGRKRKPGCERRRSARSGDSRRVQEAGAVPAHGRRRARRPAGQLGGGGLLDDVLSPQPTDVSRGNDVLGQIFGSKDVSRAVAQNAASQSGLDPGLLKKMLPMVAMLVAGYMAKQHGAGAAQPPAGGDLGSLLGGLLGGQATGAARTTPGASAPGLASMLDMNGDGNCLDDILRIAGKALR